MLTCTHSTHSPLKTDLKFLQQSVKPQQYLNLVTPSLGRRFPDCSCSTNCSWFFFIKPTKKVAYCYKKSTECKVEASVLCGRRHGCGLCDVVSKRFNADFVDSSARCACQKRWCMTSIWPVTCPKLSLYPKNRSKAMWQVVGEKPGECLRTLLKT